MARRKGYGLLCPANGFTLVIPKKQKIISAHFNHIILMDPISIYFFALASIIGLESTSIVSQKATITINPVERTFEIQQEDLFAIIVTEADSIVVVHEIQQIAEFNKNKAKRTDNGLTVDTIVFSSRNQQLNAALKGRYTDPGVWAKAGIHLDSTSTYSFSLMNFPDWNMQSSDAVLNENYWSWPTDKTVTIILEPYKNIPEEYRQHRQSLLPSWQQGLDSRSK
ncbi:hypothetical protein [Sphingobacterium arenae]|uniref:Uncharacterized protein n=1 Tax=Sphingobacterium arenae TaxID=1280598 RepID=A0ABR7Y3E1_9SPHI|nr:hypothetical protein [Sphingobacterium arenae]MBD1425776.1 hypothetical protein [Sphingobacterium arenae]